MDERFIVRFVKMSSAPDPDDHGLIVEADERESHRRLTIQIPSELLLGAMLFAEKFKLLAQTSGSFERLRETLLSDSSPPAKHAPNLEPPTVETLKESALAVAQATIQGAMTVARLSPQELADRMGVSRKAVRRMMRGDARLTVKRLAGALAACGVELKLDVEPITARWAKGAQDTEER